MFYEVRYQTGEKKEIIEEMRQGRIPTLDVIDMDDFDAFAKGMEGFGLYRVNLPYDRNARDTVREPEFEFRAAFCSDPSAEADTKKVRLMYIDVYFEPDLDKTYDTVCEI